MGDLNRIGGIHYEMMRGCYNSNHVTYKQYGEKGIKVCEEWHDRNNFRKWANENGYVKGMRIKRIDPSKDFFPENCYLGESICKLTENGIYRKSIREKNLGKKKRLEDVGIIDKTKNLRIYTIYRNMLGRCYNKNKLHFENYGGRGIEVCEEWIGEFGFVNFCEWSMNNGYSDELTLDRIDNDGNYEPSNCRWVDLYVQANNKRNSVKYEYNDGLYTLPEIARIENISRKKLYCKVKKNNISIKDAILELKTV